MSDRALREHVIYLLTGGGAHCSLSDALAAMPAELRSARVPRVSHTAWRLLEHMRIAQWDILEFCRNPQHVSPEFPDGYWPADDTPPTAQNWDQSVAALYADLAAMRALVADPATDLFAPIPHGQGQTVLREALLVADHHAYHIGQLVFLRRCLGVWPDDRPAAG